MQTVEGDIRRGGQTSYRDSDHDWRVDRVLLKHYHARDRRTVYRNPLHQSQGFGRTVREIPDRVGLAALSNLEQSKQACPHRQQHF